MNDTITQLKKQRIATSLNQILEHLAIQQTGINLIKAQVEELKTINKNQKRDVTGQWSVFFVCHPRMLLSGIRFKKPDSRLNLRAVERRPYISLPVGAALASLFDIFPVGE